LSFHYHLDTTIHENVRTELLSREVGFGVIVEEHSGKLYGERLQQGIEEKPSDGAGRLVGGEQDAAFVVEHPDHFIEILRDWGGGWGRNLRTHLDQIAGVTLIAVLVAQQVVAERRRKMLGVAVEGRLPVLVGRRLIGVIQNDYPDNEFSVPTKLTGGNGAQRNCRPAQHLGRCGLFVYSDVSSIPSLLSVSMVSASSQSGTLIFSAISSVLSSPSE